MKKLASLLIILCLCTIFSYAHATTIRYDITGGVDTEGYNFSGYVDINSNPDPDISLPTQGLNGFIKYYLTDFLFESNGDYSSLPNEILINPVYMSDTPYPNVGPSWGPAEDPRIILDRCQFPQPVPEPSTMFLLGLGMLGLVGLRKKLKK